MDWKRKAHQVLCRLFGHKWDVNVKRTKRSCYRCGIEQTRRLLDRRPPSFYSRYMTWPDDWKMMEDDGSELELKEG